MARDSFTCGAIYAFADALKDASKETTKKVKKLLREQGTGLRRETAYQARVNVRKQAVHRKGVERAAGTYHKSIKRGAEVEVYYYPKDAHAPRSELLTAAEALRASLGEGIDIGGVWLYPEDGIETDASDGVLAAMLRLEWIETAGEPEGEPMEELEYNNTGGE